MTRPLALLLSHDDAHRAALQALAAEAGCETATEASDETGIAAMRRVQPDVVVLDAIEQEISDEFFATATSLGARVVVVAPGRKGDFERGAISFSVGEPLVEAKGKGGIVKVIRAAGVRA